MARTIGELDAAFERAGSELATIVAEIAEVEGHEAAAFSAAAVAETFGALAEWHVEKAKEADHG